MQIEILKHLRSCIRSAWKGHELFAVWLVKKLKPLVIVDLGIDYGFSTFVFAIPGIGKVYGIDHFKGDRRTGQRDTWLKVVSMPITLQKRFGVDNIRILRGKFLDVAKKWMLPIDIIHFDGSHCLEDLRAEFTSWSPFVRDSGVFLFHDTGSFPEVGDFFNGLELDKYSFPNDHGLGIASQNFQLIKDINKVWNP